MTALLTVRAPLPPRAWTRRPAARLPWPLMLPGTRIYACARHGIFHGVRALGLGTGDEVLVPAYHHGSEVEAFVRAGIVPRFFAGTPRLEPDPGELESLLTARTRALHLVHYLGFPQDAARWRRWCDDHGLLLVEDAAQAWLATVDGEPVGAVGELAVFCLYKSVGIPDGAAAVGPALPAVPPAAGGWTALDLAARHAAWLGARSARAQALLARVHPQRDGYDPVRDFELGDVSGRTWDDMAPLVARLAADDVADRRRANYRELLDQLGDLVPPPFDHVPAGAAPFAFPVAVGDKHELLQRLRDHGVKALDFWSVPHPRLPADRFAAAARLRRSVVCLPVHQELRSRDLRRIARAVAGRGPARTLHVDVLDELEPLRGEWDALAEGASNIFATWDWLATWWGHFGRPGALRVVAVRDGGGRLSGLVPLYVWRERPLRTLRFLGHGPGDQLGPIAAPADRALVARALAGVLGSPRLPCDLLFGERTLHDERWASRLGGRTLQHVASPALRFGERGWEGFLAERSANFRSQVRRRERVLRRDHQVGFRLTDAATLEDDLDALVRLHRARRPTGSSFLRNEAFQRDAARAARGRDRLRLWLLEVDGAPRAAWQGFRFAGAESFYQSGRDPAWDRSSVGFVLLVHTIRAAAADGMREYRHLRGAESYKSRFATHDMELESFALGTHPLAQATARVAARVPRVGHSWAGRVARVNG